MSPDDGPHLTPDLPPGTEAPPLRGEVHPHPEESRIGRSAPLPIPYGRDRGEAEPARGSGRPGAAGRAAAAPDAGPRRRQGPPPPVRS